MYRSLTSLLFLALLTGGPAAAQRFYADDPLGKEPRILIPSPSAVERSRLLNAAHESLARDPQTDEIDPAQDVNSIGEVMDSDWFVNRIGLHPLSLQELERGPNRGEGPGMSRPWTVLKMKEEGVSPGFVVRDSRGDIYFVKLDPPGHPQLATSSEMIATGFYHAFGYYVPENYLVTIRLSDLVLDPKAEAEGQVQLEALRRLFEERGGGHEAVQVLASRQLDGKPLGPFLYVGTRPDDANDIVPHQNRRSLRALRVFASWLNDNDTAAHNTLDTFIAQDGGKGFVRHHLIDFGYCFASGTYQPKKRRAGYEYYVEFRPFLRRLATFGLWRADWETLDFPDHPVTGHFEAELFHPLEWKTNYPNPAFRRMLPQDAFWAARIVSKFSDEMIRTLVGRGLLAKRESEEYLVRVLEERRDKILRYYFSILNPISDFRVETEPAGRSVHFENLGERAGLAGPGTYRYRWHRVDARTGHLEAIGEEGLTQEMSLLIPAPEPGLLMLRIETLSPIHPHWGLPVDIYLRAGRQVIGVDRKALGLR